MAATRLSSRPHRPTTASHERNAMNRPIENRTGRPDNRDELPVLITAAELANMLSISVRTLWRLLSAGELIEPIKIGGNTRWRLDEVRTWIAKGCPNPATHNN
jgi:excisionase family DNA binding protein